MTAEIPAIEKADSAPDFILPFQLDRLAIRGRVVRLNTVMNTILQQHTYPDAVSGLLAEAVLLTALIGGSIKLRGRMSVQIRTEGALKLLATDYFAPQNEGETGSLRAYANFDADAIVQMDMKTLLSAGGIFGLILDQGTGEPYQGVTPLEPEGIARSAETYFAQSEQIATQFALAAAKVQTPNAQEKWQAGGVMIQHLPEPSKSLAENEGGERMLQPADIAAMTHQEEDWTIASSKLATVDTHELIGKVVSAERLLIRLYHEDEPRIFASQALQFGCTCSAERVEAALEKYSADSLSDMITAQGDIHADCQFCGAVYRYDPTTKRTTREPSA